MKRSIKKMSALLTMMAIAILTFTFTACNDDEENTNIEVTYTYGFSEMSASHPDFLAEMSKIEKGLYVLLHFVLTTKTLYNSINSMTNNEM
mgnify:CR=1 FL=1